MTDEERLIALNDAYYSGVLKVREKDTWVEYQSMKQIRIAKLELENKISNTRPSGTYRANVKRMF